MRYIVSIIFVISLWSCTEQLDEPVLNDVETVNGFDVRWRGQVSEECKTLIRKFLADMVYVKGGIFIMGATPEQQEYARKNEYPTMCTQLNDFFIASHEIMPQEYWCIMGGREDNGLPENNLSISWNDWRVFIDILNDMTNLEFDIPTECQWEYAARGGEYTKGYIYPGSNSLEEVRSVSDTEGSSVPNELGLYNMADLRSEWCKDYYAYYTLNTFIENRYVSTGKNMVVRGGNWYCRGKTNKYLNATLLSDDIFGKFRTPGSMMNPFDYRYCRTTARSWHSPSTNSNYIGCRLVINKK